MLSPFTSRVVTGVVEYLACGLSLAPSFIVEMISKGLKSFDCPRQLFILLRTETALIS